MRLDWPTVLIGDTSQSASSLFAVSLIKSAPKSCCVNSSRPSTHSQTHKCTGKAQKPTRVQDARAHAVHPWVVSQHVWLCPQWFMTVLPRGKQIGRSHSGSRCAWVWVIWYCVADLALCLLTLKYHRPESWREQFWLNSTMRRSWRLSENHLGLFHF